jgi:hypothetical protein
MTFEDFNQPLGLTMNANNRWVQKADQIPWRQLEKDYAKSFHSKTGNVAKPFRMAFGAILIQDAYGYSDEELVLQIQENPYLQFFIGLPGYQDKKPFDASSMTHFRKRLDLATLTEINEKILQFNKVNDDKADDDNDDNDDNNDDKPNSGTLILDATCAPQEIKFPTDTELLNDARVHAEKIIDAICHANKLVKPRIYRKCARKVYLNIVRRKRKTAKWLRKEIRKLLNYLKRDIGIIRKFLAQFATLSDKELAWWETIQVIYEQQQEMYDKKTHSVESRIVSFSQPWIRPIVRGKAKSKVEFGAKVDLSIDSRGFARLEKTSFEAYNESSVLVTAIRRFHDREGHYPERILVDKIYRNRENIRYCKARGIRISGPRLGKPSKNQTIDKALEYQDNADRVGVERAFSLLKRCHGMLNIRTKLPETTLTILAIGTIGLNLDRLMSVFLHFVWNLSRFLDEIGAGRRGVAGVCYSVDIIYFCHP